MTAFAAKQSILCSPVYQGNIAKYGHMCVFLGKRRAEFRCRPDCVAERETFEPSVQV